MRTERFSPDFIFDKNKKIVRKELLLGFYLSRKVMLYKNTQFETVYTFEVIFDQPPTDCKSINKKAD